MGLLKKLFVIVSSVAIAASGVAFPLAAHAATNAPLGAVLKDSSGTIFFITADNQRRPFTSAGAFQSYGFLSFNQVASTTTYSDFSALPTGSFIPPRDGSVFCATTTKGTDVAGECALITGGMKASFISSVAFTGLGFSFSRAQYGDSSFLSRTNNIDNTTSAHRPGVLVNINGTIYLVGPSSLLGIPSSQVFGGWGYSFADAVPANAADLAIPKSGVMPARVAGQLNPISAYAPTVKTENVTGVLSTSAYLTGKVFTNGAVTSYWFEYGTTANLGTSTPSLSVGSEVVSKDPFTSVSKLSPGTKYYYRLTAENQYGKAYGETLSFTTAN